MFIDKYNIVEHIEDSKVDEIDHVEVNGDDDEDIIEESKYTTASGATAAENDISEVIII